MKVYFVSSNPRKAEEFAEILGEFGIAVEHIQEKYPEIQADALETVVKFSSLQVSQRHKHPTIIEDAGLFIDALKGFPGPYSSFVQRTIGNRGILKLMEKIEQRDSTFVSAIAYSEPKKTPRIFIGKTEGTIAHREKGRAGWGYDPIFIPHGGGGKTFAEMGIEVKNRFSHRRKSLESFSKWFFNR